MSVENVNAFIEKFNSDETFRNQIVAASDNKSRLNIACEAGYDFSLEELQQSMPAQAEGELSDDELEVVAGGISLNFEEIKVTFKLSKTGDNYTATDDLWK